MAVGDVVKLTDVKINKYFDSVTLKSTSITNIEQVTPHCSPDVLMTSSSFLFSSLSCVQVQKVANSKHKLQIVAVSKCQKRQTHLEVILDQRFHTMVVKTKLLAEAYSLGLGENFKSHLVEALPLMGEAQIQGNEIKAIQNIEA